MVAQLGQTIRTLTDERNRSAAILSSMVEGVAVIGSDERILYCNQAFEQILELPQGSSQGKNLSRRCGRPNWFPRCVRFFPEATKSREK